jgi:hypothetical protein
LLKEGSVELKAPATFAETRSEKNREP